MKNPLVSIVIPVYNGSNYLREAIDSTLAQTYKHIEVIVVNDGSTDIGATARIAKSYGSKIKYFPKKNGGVATALNFGIKHMKGVWFSWLSHDDTYKETKIESLIKYASLHPQARVLYTDYELVDSKLRHLHDIRVRPGPLTNMCLRLMDSYPLNGCAMLIHKECFIKVGLFDVKKPTTQDYDLWFRLAGKYEYDYVPISTIKSRQHAGQASHSNQHKEEVDKLYVKFLGELRKSPHLLNQIDKPGQWLLKLAMTYRERGYLFAPKFILNNFSQYINKLSLVYYFARIYCSLPTTYLIAFTDFKHHLIRTMFSLTGYIKRLIISPKK